MSWDGRPENPEHNGWHWVADDAQPSGAIAYWHAAARQWSADDAASIVWDCFPTDAMQDGGRYLGPCLTPAEIAAREQAARKAALREAAAVVSERGAWASNDADAESMSMAAECRAAILALIKREPGACP